MGTGEAMKGRKPFEYKLKPTDRRMLKAKLGEGHLMQRIANRVRALLGLDSGERISAIGHWTGLSRTALWYLWQRYKQRGVEAVYDAQRSGRPPVFSPSGAGPH